jgi:hypothetical protein
MLYNKNWDAKTVTSDPFTLESLVAWLEKQPASERYCYSSGGECLLHGYFADAGFANVHVFTNGFWSGADKIPSHVGAYEAMEIGRLTAFPAAFDRISFDGERTFGAALKRARKALGK